MGKEFWRDGDYSVKVKWLDKPEDHDFGAAEDYLSLLMPEAVAAGIRRELEEKAQEKLIRRRAKDLLRASALPLLPSDNRHVRSDLEKIGKGEELSPVLCVRGMTSSVGAWRPLIFADGYHRLCAVYWTDENTRIPVVLA